MSDQEDAGVYRGTCEDCGWSYESEHRRWVELAARNHRQIYRLSDDHDDTEIEGVQ